MTGSCSKELRVSIRTVATLVACTTLALTSTTPKVTASGIVFQTGDVLAAVGNGHVAHLRPDGTQVDLLNTGVSSFDTGMAFDANGNLYVTGFDANAVFKFDHNGQLLGTFGGGYNADPESIVFDKSGNAYVGQPDGTHQILKFSPAGGLLATYNPPTSPRGTDWIDLAADQCTLHYTSEGSSIQALDVCTGTQMPAFAVGLAGPCFAHRIRPNSDELLACASRVYRFNSVGVIVQTYTVPNASELFALNLDPDNKTFWTGDIINGLITRVDISTGTILSQFSSGASNTGNSFLAGLTVVGEITAAAATVPIHTSSYYIKTKNSSVLRAAGQHVAQEQAATGNPQDGAVALLFGAPAVVNGQSGATLWNGGRHSTLSEVAALVEDFAVGYYNCFGTASCQGTSQSKQDMRVRIIVSTNNSGGSVNFQQGQAWAEMINTLATRIVALRYSGRIDIAAGNDMEPDYNSPAITRSWVNGYASTAHRYLYDVGDASGCPSAGTAANPAHCGTVAHPDWTQEDLWFISWGADPAVPLPEIYCGPCGSFPTKHAAQWQSLSLYGFLANLANPVHGGAMIIAGALTQNGACLQSPNDPTCKPTPNQPQQGWQQLRDTLNADSRVAQTLPWSTDIRHLRTVADLSLNGF
jgi:sugar lactone lactonase YvrE